MKRFIKLSSVLLMLVMMLSMFSSSALSLYNTKFYFHPGNVDGGYNITINDATLLQKYLIKTVSDDKIRIAGADFNGDGNININDVTNIQKYLARLDYDCYIKSDFSYLTGVYEKGPETDCTIDSVNLIEYPDYPFIQQYLPLDEYDSTYLVTSKEQLLAVTNYYSPDFDDEFFKENALVIRFVEEKCEEYKNSITKIEFENNTLYVRVKKEFTGIYPDMVSPSNPTWNLIYQVKKADIQGVEKLVVLSG